MEKLANVALAFSIFAGAYDYLTQRIPNWLTFSAILLGLLAQGYNNSWTGLLTSFIGILVAFLVFSPMYFLKWMGAGDVKLLMAVGAWSSWHFCIYVAIVSIFIGGAYALFDTIRVGRFLPFVKAAYRSLRSMMVPSLVLEKPKLSDRKFSFGVAVACAVGIVIFLQNQGRL